MLHTCWGAQAARSRVALPSQTQSWALVVDSLGLRFCPNWLAAALAAPRTGMLGNPPVAVSDGWGLNLLANTTHETTKTTMAKQNAASNTYNPISRAVILEPLPLWRTPTPPMPPENFEAFNPIFTDYFLVLLIFTLSGMHFLAWTLCSTAM